MNLFNDSQIGFMSAVVHAGERNVFPFLFLGLEQSRNFVPVLPNHRQNTHFQKNHGILLVTQSALQ